MNLVVFDIEQVSIDSDKSEGVIPNPFAFLSMIQRGFSGPIQSLPTRIMQIQMAVESMTEMKLTI